MRSEIPFKNKFADYLTKKITPHKMDTLFNGQFSQQSDSSNTHKCSSTSNNNQLTFEDSSFTHTPQSNISIFSFNSSEFTQSKYRSSKGVQSTSGRKRLKKLRELQQNECAICLDQIKNRCQLECKHKFCHDCLQGWLDNSSKCPYCRAEVRCFWFKGEEYKVQPKEFEYEGTAEQNLDWVCYLCDHTEDGDIVLICDRCEANACHVECDETLNGVQPVGEWICHFCR